MKIELPKELQKGFRLKNWPGNGTRQNFGKFGVVDIVTISESQANQLVRKGFPYIEKLKTKANPTTST